MSKCVENPGLLVNLALWECVGDSTQTILQIIIVLAVRSKSVRDFT